MTKEQWIDKVKKHQVKLISLIEQWHPHNIRPEQDLEFKITAPNAERATRGIREDIKSKTTESPSAQFLRAIEESDEAVIYRILQQAWFGVPESTSCWRIEGFVEAVDLLDDPVDYEGAN